VCRVGGACVCVCMCVHAHARSWVSKVSVSKVCACVLSVHAQKAIRGKSSHTDEKRETHRSLHTPYSSSCAMPIGPQAHVPRPTPACV
jgi:hypothetical protein